MYCSSCEAKGKTGDRQANPTQTESNSTREAGHWVTHTVMPDSPPDTGRHGSKSNTGQLFRCYPDLNDRHKQLPRDHLAWHRHPEWHRPWNGRLRTRQDLQRAAMGQRGLAGQDLGKDELLVQRRRNRSQQSQRCEWRRWRGMYNGRLLRQTGLYIHRKNSFLSRRRFSPHLQIINPTPHRAKSPRPSPNSTSSAASTAPKPSTTSPS